MTLSEFEALIRSALKRGTTVDAEITTGIRQAARFIEQNHSLKYMQRWYQLTTDVTAAEPRILTLLEELKSTKFIRYTNSDGKYTYLRQIDPTEIGELETAEPTAYWLDGTYRMVLAQTPKENMTFDYFGVFYTKWPVDADAQHWLMTNAEAQLTAQSMLHIAPLIRDRALATEWKERRDEGLRTLLLADEEMEASDRSDSMAYGAGMV